MANTTPIVTTVTKPTTKEKTPKEADATPRVNIQDFCEEHYEDILPVIIDKIRHDKRKEVHARLDFEESPKKRRIREGSQNSSARTLSARYRNPPERLKVRDRLRYNERHVLDRLGHRRQSAFDRLSDTYRPSTTKSGPGSQEPARGVEESYDNTRSSWTGTKHGYHSRDRDRSRYVKRGRESESPLSRVSESGTSDGGHWKSKSKRHKSTDEDDLAVPWICEEVDPFTPRIRNFKSSRKTRMPNNVKTYDGTGDPEDHVKIFQAAAQVERWAMPTWCHMFNSTLIGAARVWFDELPPESIDGYKDLKAAFLAYFMQQKKYVKYPVKIHNIKQRDRETTEEFMERFKPLNEHVSKTMEEMMIATTVFIRGEAVAAGKKKGQPREGWGSSKFTPFTRIPKEIPVAEAGKFKPPPPMVTPMEKRSSNKFCDFHNDKGHKIKQGRGQPKVGKKSMAIYMIQPWHRMTRQKVTQSFERVSKITFPSLTTSSGTEGPLVIEAEIGGHMIHRISPVDGGIVTIRSTILIPAECATVITSSKEIPKEAGVRHENFKVALHLNFPDQEVAIGGTLSAKGRTELCSLLKENLDIFAWQPSDMTGVPRSIAEHRLNIQEGLFPVRQRQGARPPEHAKPSKTGTKT
ncbi:reverse transcriptase domain-containing protein [Tanacetum coccineum]